MNVCKVDGCDNKVSRRGWCANHYERWRRNGDPTVSGWEVRRQRQAAEAAQNPQKACKKCGEVKPLSDFYRRLTPSLWYYTKCKECHDKIRAAKTLQARLDNPQPPKPKKDHGPCQFNGCHNKARTRIGNGPEGWYCIPHFDHWKKYGELRVITPSRKSYINEDFRRCTACDAIKPQEDFHKRTGGGRQTNCKVCQYKVVLTNRFVREGRYEEALDVAQSMAERHREKYVPKVLAVINEAGRGEES